MLFSLHILRVFEAFCVMKRNDHSGYRLVKQLILLTDWDRLVSNFNLPYSPQFILAQN